MTKEKETQTQALGVSTVKQQKEMEETRKNVQQRVNTEVKKKEVLSKCLSEEKGIGCQMLLRTKNSLVDLLMWPSVESCGVKV